MADILGDGAIKVGWVTTIAVPGAPTAAEVAEFGRKFEALAHHGAKHPKALSTAADVADVLGLVQRALQVIEQLGGIERAEQIAADMRARSAAAKSRQAAIAAIRPERMLSNGNDR